MLILLAKLLIPPLIPLAGTIIWKRYARATWVPVTAALAAATIYSLVRIPLREYVWLNPSFFPAEFGLAPALGPRVIAVALIYGAARGTVQWLIMGTQAAGMKTWRDAVLFALAYTTAATTVSTWNSLESLLVRAVIILELIPRAGPLMPIEMIASLRQAPLSLVVEIVNARFPLRGVPIRAVDLNLSSLLLNFGISLAILYSVRRRKIWPFAAAVIGYAFVTLTPTLMLGWSLHSVRGLASSNIIAGKIISLLYDLLGDYLGVLLYFLPAILGALPALALGLYIRKIMAAAEPGMNIHTPTQQGLWRTLAFIFTAALLLTSLSSWRTPDFTIARPTNVQLHVDSDNASVISWTGFEGAEQFEVEIRYRTSERNDFPKWLTDNYLTKTTFVHSWINPGTVYQYRIRGSDINLTPVGGWSEIVTRTVPMRVIPEPTSSPTETPTPTPRPNVGDEPPGGASGPPPTRRPLPPTPVIDG